MDSECAASKYYDILADYYEAATAPALAWTPPQMVAKFAKNYLQDSSSVLDLGIGTGQSIRFLLDGVKKYSITGLDVSAKMLDICRNKYPELTLFHGDIFAFSKIASSRYDLILSSGALEFVADIEAVVREVRRLLSPQGAFVFTYEPQILFHEFQNEAAALTVENRSSKLFVDEFRTYRRSPQSIRSMLTAQQFKIHSAELFVAYKKKELPIVYEIIAAHPAK